MAVFGNITVTFSSGPAITGPGTYNNDDPAQLYLDYSGKPYPTSIDMKKATAVSFQPHMGKTVNFSKWTYFFNGGWVGPRLIVEL
jgi:hypothetical protein